MLILVRMETVKGRKFYFCSLIGEKTFEKILTLDNICLAKLKSVIFSEDFNFFLAFYFMIILEFLDVYKKANGFVHEIKQNPLQVTRYKIHEIGVRGF